MTEILDSGNTRVVAYLVVAALAALWGLRERRSPAAEQLEWWPTYWFLSAGLLVAMGIARAGALGDLVSEIGRDQARSSGWYEARRTLQVAAVVVMVAIWLIGVVVAIWRVPPRRRRYLPHVITVSGLIVFAAVRLVSLHHIDTVLYRRNVGGIRIVAILELTALAITALAMVAFSRFGAARRATGEPVGSSSR